MRFHTLILGHKQGHRFCGGRVLWFGTISEDRTNREVVLFANQGPGTRANDGHRSVVCRLKIDTERAIARGEGDGLMGSGFRSQRVTEKVQKQLEGPVWQLAQLGQAAALSAREHLLPVEDLLRLLGSLLGQSRSFRAPVDDLERPSARRISPRDRKSTRLNSSHGYISYAVFCLKKKKKTKSSRMYYSLTIRK